MHYLFFLCLHRTESLMSLYLISIPCISFRVHSNVNKCNCECSIKFDILTVVIKKCKSSKTTYNVIVVNCISGENCYVIQFCSPNDIRIIWLNVALV